MNVLVTGAHGFIGQNLWLRMAEERRYAIAAMSRDDVLLPDDLRIRNADYLVHLAGVNRPKDPMEYTIGNRDLTARWCAALDQCSRPVPILYASSSQAVLDNPYGVSKRAAEGVLVDYARRSGARVVILRLPNVFGAHGRPYYNSVVATFCHELSHGKSITVRDGDTEVELVHVDDVVSLILQELERQGSPGVQYPDVAPLVRISVRDLAALISRIHVDGTAAPSEGVPLWFIDRLAQTYRWYAELA